MAEVVIGVPLYNGGAHVPEALESLLGQTHRDFAIVLVDDGSSDDTPEVVADYASRDSRLHLERNPERLGMIANWRRAFELADELNPDMEYFAWASDHDVWDPAWLATLHGHLDGRDEVVLAYPITARISPTGEELKRAKRILDTSGMPQIRRRLRVAVRDMMAGDMVYGLFRADALRRAGVFRPVLLPDRLLLSELCVHGRFSHVKEVLFHRRMLAQPSFKRQRASFFPGRAPVYSYLPWWIAHTSSLFGSLVIDGRGRPEVGRTRGFLVVLHLFALDLAYEVKRQLIALYRLLRLNKLTRRVRKRSRSLKRGVITLLGRIRRRAPGSSLLSRLSAHIRRTSR